MEQINSVYVNRKFNCSVERLFEWMVEPTLICQWFGPQNIRLINADIDLNIGGKLCFELEKPNGERFFIAGEYLEIESPNKLQFSFAYRGLPNSPPASIVIITISPIDSNIAQLSLVQKFSSTPKDIARRTEAWKNMFNRLNDKLVDNNLKKSIKKGN